MAEDGSDWVYVAHAEPGLADTRVPTPLRNDRQPCDLCGAVDHRVVLFSTGSRTMTEDGREWLVRSPWPSIALRDALNLVWRSVERDEQARYGDVRRARAAEALAWTEAEAQRRLFE